MGKKKKFSKKTQFISVEVVLKTNHKCDKFVKWYEKQDNCVVKLKWDTHKWYVYFAPLPSKNPDKTIKAICKDISSLPKGVRKEWDKADFREFNIGYHAGEEPFSYLDNISSKTIKKVEKLKAGIGISLYAAELTDKKGIPKDFYDENN